MKRLEHVTCFTTGAAILVLELAAFRLLAPYFGTSSHVTGIIINTILLALASGYMVGGAAADRHRSVKLPFLVILGSAAYLGVIYACCPSLLRRLAYLPVVPGSCIAVVILLFIPMALLAFIPPYFIRTLSRENPVGTTSGRVYALSTLGSILGGLATTFWLLPDLGTRFTFLTAVGLLLAISGLGLARFSRLSLLLPALLVPLLFFPAVKRRGVIHAVESEYNIIQVTEEGGHTYLKLNENLGYHSMTLDRETKLTGDYFDLFLFPQVLTNARETLILGNGAGTAMIETHHFFDTNIDGVELDSALTEVGREFFDLRLDQRLSIHCEDARAYLLHSDKRYDVVCVDIFAGSPYVPFHTTTVEFFELVCDALDEDGIVAVNIPSYALETELAEYFYNTLARVFPDVFFARRLAFGFKGGMDSARMRSLVEARELSPSLRTVTDAALTDVRRVGCATDERYFTDDKAPVEQMAFRLMRRLRDGPPDVGRLQARR